MQEIKKRYVKRFCTLWIAIALLSLCSCATTPYRSKFQCPATYPGRCETIQTAYQDSTHNFDARLFDKKWVKREREWEKKNAELIEARKKAGIKAETVDEKLAKFQNATSTTRSDSGYDYRQKLFDELKGLLSEPEKPIVVPPKVVRVLVLSTLAQEQGKRRIFVSPHYIYFMLDQPRWLLHKVPEKIPFDTNNPLIREEK